jgi:hypothetical protein
VRKKSKGEFQSPFIQFLIISFLKDSGRLLFYVNQTHFIGIFYSQTSTGFGNKIGFGIGSLKKEQ